MSAGPNVIRDEALTDAVARLGDAATARKCWSCGCLHNALDAIERAIPPDGRPPQLHEAVNAARGRLLPVRYDCLGCETCYPPLAMNALNIEAEACPADDAEQRPGWPPLPGAYTVLRYGAPAAVCTLTDERLHTAVASAGDSEIAMVGTCQTENLGIERLILNTLSNPNIRFLVVCGADSRQAVGHLPGQALVALARAGVNEGHRIIGAQGKRPILRNLSPEAIEHFRRAVEVVDLIGISEADPVLAAVSSCAARNPGPATPYGPQRLVTTVRGALPEHMVPDPRGYFVLYVDRSRRLLSLEHYDADGVLDVVVEGAAAAELYCPAIERGLVSRLDHAAYLGRELTRAERALATGEDYVQDSAPCQARPPVPDCGCGSSCGGGAG